MTTVSDSFDRANSSSLGSNWSEDSGEWVIASNAIRQETATGAYRKLRWVGTALAGANNYVEAPVAFGTDGNIGAGVAVRMATSSTVTFYALIGFPGSGWYIVEITAGAESILDSGGTCNASTTYTARIEVDGTNIRGLVNGVEVVSASDASLTSGGVGLIAYGGTNNPAVATTFTSFTAGDLGITGTASLTLAALAPTGAGTVAITGAANLSLAALTISAAGGSGAISGAANLSLGALAPTGAGAVAIAGQASLSLGALTISAAGGAGAITGTADLSLGALSSVGGSLRFYGTGSGNIDRVRIPLDTGGVSTPVDVGAADFTIEAFIQFDRADNTADIAGGDARNSNIVWDRDIWGHPRGWVVGLTRSGSDTLVCFGMAESGGGWVTISGTTNVGDGNWHHVALTFEQSTRRITLWVDGVSNATRIYDQSDLSYPDGYDPGAGLNNPYLVLGAEKHDAGGSYPSYDGYMTELRISDTRRYTSAFTRPASKFSPDANAVGLYHFEDGSGTTLSDAATVSGAPTNGALLVGGSPSGPAWAGVSFLGGMTGALAIAGAASLALGALTPAGVGGLRLAGAASLTLAALSTSAAGAVAIAGTASLSLGALTLSAAGGIGAFGAADLTLGTLTLSAAGELDIAGAGTLSLAALAPSGAGAVAIAGVASLALGEIALSAAGGFGRMGTADLTLGALAPSGAGVLAIAGAADLSLSALTVSGSGAGAGSITGAADLSLAALVLTGVGVLMITGSATLNLGSLTLDQLALVTVARSISGPGRVGSIQSARAGTISGG